MSKSTVFFIYYGHSSMALNHEVLQNLITEDVSHLSTVEQEFFAWYQQNNPVEIHSGTCQKPQPTQQEECEFLMDMIRHTEALERGDAEVVQDTTLC